MTNIYSELKIWTVDVWPLCLLLSGSKISHNCSLKGKKGRIYGPLEPQLGGYLLPSIWRERNSMSSSWNSMAQGQLVQTLFHWPQKPHSPGTSSLFTHSHIQELTRTVTIIVWKTRKHVLLRLYEAFSCLAHAETCQTLRRHGMTSMTTVMSEKQKTVHKMLSRCCQLREDVVLTLWAYRKHKSWF